MTQASNDSTARLRKAATQPKRRGGSAWIFLLVSLTGALATAGLVTHYIDKRLRGAKVATVPVVVAAVDLPLATTLTADMLETVDWPAESVPEGVVKDPATLVGRVATTKLTKAEPILLGKLAAEGAGAGLAAILPPEMRAVAVRVDDVVGVAGFIHPGDSVDVIVTMKPSDNAGSLATAKVILQNIRVLAVGKQIEPDEASKKKTLEATVATLMVDGAQAERLALAAAKGKLLLALRSSRDTIIIETPGIVPPTLLQGTLAEAENTAAKAARRPPKPMPAAVPAPPPEQDSVVEILRGDRMEERSFKEK